MKKILYICLGLIVVVGVYGAMSGSSSISTDKQSFDPRNTTYVIDGFDVTLVDGVSSVSVIPDSASKIVTRYFGNESIGDLDGDGRDDTSYLITQDRGGSGTFYYVVVALNKEDGYEVTNVFFVGDRISPQSTNINTSARELYVNYVERRSGEPMTAQPSQGATLYLKVTSDGVLEGLMK